MQRQLASDASTNMAKFRKHSIDEKRKRSKLRKRRKKLAKRNSSESDNHPSTSKLHNGDRMIVSVQNQPAKEKELERFLKVSKASGPDVRHSCPVLENDNKHR